MEYVKVFTGDRIIVEDTLELKNKLQLNLLEKTENDMLPEINTYYLADIMQASFIFLFLHVMPKPNQ